MTNDRPWPALGRVLRDGWRYRAATLATLLATATATASAWLLLWLAERVLTHLNAVQAATGDMADLLDGLRSAALALMVGALPAAAAAYVAWRTGQSLANRCARDLRERFVAHLVRLDLAFHAGQSRGDLLSRMTADLDRLYGVQSALYGRLLQRSAQAIGCAGYVSFVSWRLGVVLFLVLLPTAAVLSRGLGRMRRRSQRAQESLATTLSAFEQITAGIRVIKTMGSTEREVARYGDLNARLFGARQRVARARARSEARPHHRGRCASLGDGATRRRDLRARREDAGRGLGGGGVGDPPRAGGARGRVRALGAVAAARVRAGPA